MRLWHLDLLLAALAAGVIGIASHLHVRPSNTAECRQHAGWQDKLTAATCAEFR